MIDPISSPLLTDLYEYTMLQTYIEQGMEETAVFEFFVRRLPPGRNFLVAAGLEQALTFLENLAFSQEELAWLSERFPKHVIQYLEKTHFTGDVHAMAEGTIFFPNEPILRVTAPLPVAQLVESRVMNILNFETLIASKAARSVLVAPHKLLVDFGLRRAHGAEAGILAARASYLAGFAGTATVLAGMLYEIPIFGTMAHSFIQAHDDETMAFEHFVRSHPNNAILLIDTYDTERAAEKVVTLAARLKDADLKIRGVRIDSGDLAVHARKVRQILDNGGLEEVTIFLSGNLDEYQLKTMIDEDVPFNGIGIGTALDTSSDAPMLDCAYKLEEYNGRPRRKRSEGKATWPGRKQVYRAFDDDRMIGDILALAEDDPYPGTQLICPVMGGGKRLESKTPLKQLRGHTLDQYSKLPLELRGLDSGAAYPVEISRKLQELARNVDSGKV